MHKYVRAEYSVALVSPIPGLVGLSSPADRWNFSIGILYTFTCRTWSPAAILIV